MSDSTLETSDSSPDAPLQTAVLFLVFNRPDTTRQVFKAIRQAKPSRLYVAADGPRAEYAGEIEKVQAVREYVLSNIDWECEIKTLLRKDNVGCKYAVSGGINWFFDHEKQGIILEDDCVPHPDFFFFCEVLLERYSDDHRVSVITGNNFQFGQRRNKAAYYFSKYNHCWGWASWRRAWSLYCGDIAFWPDWKRSPDWHDKTADPVERRYWSRIFDKVYAGAIDSWAYPWTASLWYKGGLTATPNVNLVSNIGFGGGATHTTSAGNKLAGLPTEPLGELSHPAHIEKDITADRFIFDSVLGGKYRRFPWNLARLPRLLIGSLYHWISRRLEY